MPSRTPALLASLAAAIVVAACQVVQGPARSTEQPTVSPSTTATPSRAPAASPTPRPEQVAINQFVKRVTAGTFRYRVTFRGDARATVSIVSTRGTLNAVGRNYGLVVDFTFAEAGGRARVEHRYVGGKAWLRQGSGRWSSFKGFIAEESMSPFAAIVDATDVEFVELARTRGQADRYRIAVPTGFFHPALIPAYNLGAEQVDKSELVLLIDAKGVPVSGTSRITARGRVSGQLQEVVIQSRLTFTAIGSKRVVVRAP